ncbi:hypothetical protein NDU88_001023 [Pleurodeles waltl]|uniref:Uncharacterized protein n=1 Tax=Pleurodeles waltl TaxID=8319 RepID=A0AAV7L8A2_PLEWA|nr:hypothetical protein NDU88_001023 [Pleurodeles waltl]
MGGEGCTTVSPGFLQVAHEEEVAESGEQSSAQQPREEESAWCRAASQAALWDPEVSTPRILVTASQGGVMEIKRAHSAEAVSQESRVRHRSTSGYGQVMAAPGDQEEDGIMNTGKVESFRVGTNLTVRLTSDPIRRCCRLKRKYTYQYQNGQRV